MDRMGSIQPDIEGRELLDRMMSIPPDPEELEQSAADYRRGPTEGKQPTQSAVLQK